MTSEEASVKDIELSMETGRETTTNFQIEKGLTGKPFKPFALARDLKETDFGRASPHSFEHVLEMDEESELAFLLNIFRLKGTAMLEVWPQLVLSWVMCAVASLVYMFTLNATDADDDASVYWMPHDAKTVYSAVGSILGFLVVFRSSQSYASYVEGRKILGGICNNLREMAMNTYTFQTRDGINEDDARVVELRARIRRNINLLFAVMRQQMRESQEGFEPDSDIEKRSRKAADFGEFWKENWYADPIEPRVSSLMSEEEFNALNVLGSNVRPAWVEVQLNTNAHLLSKYLKEPGFFLQAFARNAEDTVNLFKGAYRIVETPVPMPYRHILYVLIFIYVYITPWVYVDNGEHWQWQAGWTASTLICLAYYGIMELAAKLQNPFGWDQIDLDLETFGKRVHNETKVISHAVHRRFDPVDYMQPLDSNEWNIRLGEAVAAPAAAKPSASDKKVASM